jgi:hypothetical protein
MQQETVLSHYYLKSHLYCSEDCKCMVLQWQMKYSTTAVDKILSVTVWNWCCESSVSFSHSCSSYRVIRNDALTLNANNY